MVYWLLHQVRGAISGPRFFITFNSNLRRVLLLNFVRNSCIDPFCFLSDSVLVYILNLLNKVEQVFFFSFTYWSKHPRPYKP